MLGAYALGSRPLAASPRLPRAFKIATQVGEFGWAAWSFSRQGKLNAWSWHGIGGTRMNAWAVLGSCIYVRKEADTFVHVMQPETFLAANDTNTDSDSVEASTQWLDFGQIGKMKALTGIDCDAVGVETIEVYIAVGGNRDGVLAESIPIGSNNGGWTYNGEVIPLNVAATEFKLRFIGNANTEVQVNRCTLLWEPIAG